MKATVRPLKAETEFYLPEGCHIIEVSNSDDDPQLSIARARVEPGVSTRWHRLMDTAERYVILKGTGIVEVGELIPQQVAEGDVVLIPPGSPQRITNSGEVDLVFLAICTPRFLPDSYQDIDS